MEETKCLLSKGGEYPLSVVIVGVGEDRFESMKLLDGADVKNAAEGVNIRRDIC